MLLLFSTSLSIDENRNPTEKGSGMEVSGRGFQDLPEGCIAHVISLTSPRDSCRSAGTSTAFRAAAESDTVWDRFLPSDICSVLSRAVEPVECSSRRELFFRLCDPILIDGGRMSFALDKSSGAKCYMLSAREMKIVWGDTPSYWHWLSADDYSYADEYSFADDYSYADGYSFADDYRYSLSLPPARFSEVAHLVGVCWLEIGGSIDRQVLSPNTTYAAHLVFKLVGETSSFTHPPQKVSVKAGDNESSHTVRLQPPTFNYRRHYPHGLLFDDDEEEETEETTEGDDASLPCSRADGWMEVEMGEFFNKEGEDGEVEMSLMEVEGGHWKNGLIIHGIEVRPKKN
ncbi:F-box protein PP2-B10-like isoform X1 [Iris pallida]|uniref:F-box protein PP2-B10-like isoform X1 n=1 Tax=Iris pallida TaxID=29817 RepID=A0AAX6FV29_IRIPA|nr:F-box protein PP2-B10-like isoform X1 [Iris pallida]